MGREPDENAPDHGVIDDAPSVPGPLSPTEPAEDARTLVARTNVCSLATLTAGGDPWASLATHGLLDDGSPVLGVSHLAEHARNLAVDSGVSLLVTQVDGPSDRLAAARVTFAGRAERDVAAGLMKRRQMVSGAAVW